MPEKTSTQPLLGAQDQQLDAEQDQLPCGSTGTSSGNRLKTGPAWLGHITYAKTASPKSSFRALWKVGDAVVGKGNAG